jgi:hypothetical protein
MLVDPKRVVVVMWCSVLMLCINMCRSLYRYEAKADLRTQDFSPYSIKEKVPYYLHSDSSVSGRYIFIWSLKELVTGHVLGC